MELESTVLIIIFTSKVEFSVQVSTLTKLDFERLRELEMDILKWTCLRKTKSHYGKTGIFLLV